MTYRFEWYDETQTILLHHVEGAWTPLGFAQSVREGNALIAEKAHTVHVITLFTRAKIPIGKPGEAARGASMPANRGIVVLVGISAALELMLNVMRVTLPAIVRDTYTARSLEEALDVIKQHSDTL